MLNDEGAFKKADQEDKAADGAIFLDPKAIKQVVDKGVSRKAEGNCPDGSQAKLCGGCIPS
jgi:hypothetical protein